MSDHNRWLDTDGVARHISVKPGAVRRLVRLGRIPQPDYQLGKRAPRWDRDLIDKAMGSGVINGAAVGTSAADTTTTASRANVEHIRNIARRARSAPPSG